jgi:hypothetical protein
MTYNLFGFTIDWRRILDRQINQRFISGATALCGPEIMKSAFVSPALLRVSSSVLGHRTTGKQSSINPVIVTLGAITGRHVAL